MALDFSPHPNNRSLTLTALLATGKIAAGDADRLSAYLAALPKKKNTALYLSSTGGDLHESMRLLYGQDVNAPIELLIVGFSTPSAEMFYISNSDVCALGIKLWSVENDRLLCND